VSDNYLRIIPVEPTLIPPEATARNAVERIGPLFPDSDEVVAKSYGHPVFIDQGANLEAIICPSCGARLPFYPADLAEHLRAWWDDIADPLDEVNVADLRVTMICCRASVLFSDLSYDWPAGVASFEISIMNPGRADGLSGSELTELQEILGCQVKQIWAHY
jgi:hypothetical protein